jgi:catechol 2,3-dioxygenase-like lactoylglutathione lyase family enzyme
VRRLFVVALFAAVCFAQTGTSTPLAGPVLGILNYIHAVDNLDTTLAFYNEVFGLKGEPRPFPNPGVPALTNSPGVSLRLAVLKLPNASFGFELTQFSGIDRHPGRAKHTDPGAGLLALRVKDMAPVLAALKRRNDPIVTTSDAPVTIATPRGEIHSMVVQDPDGYFIEVAQSAPPANVSTDGNVYDVSIGLTIADREKTLKFYHDLLGFDLKGAPDFSNDPVIADMVGAPHVQSREMIATIPGTKSVWAFYDYKGVSRKPFHLRVPDPGAPAVALRVQDLDGLLKRMRDAGVPFTSKDGEVVQFSATIRNIFVEDPNGLNIELFESKQ